MSIHLLNPRPKQKLFSKNFRFCLVSSKIVCIFAASSKDKRQLKLNHKQLKTNKL